MKLLTLDIEKIVANSNQPRKYFDKERMAELKQSIGKNGLIQPITVRKTLKGKYEIVAGERRYRACMELGMTEIAAIEVSAGDARAYEMSVLENIQREDLNPVEEAESYVMLMEVYGYTQEKLAERLGKTRSSISNKVRLLKLPLKVKEMVKKGEISYGHARTLLSLPDERSMEQLAMKIVESGYSVRETEKRARMMSEGKISPKGKGRSKHVVHNLEDDKFSADHVLASSESSPDYGQSYHEDSERAFLEEKLREFFETGIEIKGELHGKGKIEISFYSYEDLERIIGLMKVFTF